MTKETFAPKQITTKFPQPPLACATKKDHRGLQQKGSRGAGVFSSTNGLGD